MRRTLLPARSHQVRFHYTMAGRFTVRGQIGVLTAELV